MSDTYLTDEELLEKLNANPILKHRISRVLLVIEGERGTLREAEAAEMRLIDEMRQMGRENLTTWAQDQVRKTTVGSCQAHGVWREGKKLRRHTTIPTREGWLYLAVVIDLYSRQVVG
jgi:transposase InsO family protein